MLLMYLRELSGCSVRWKKLYSSFNGTYMDDISGSDTRRVLQWQRPKCKGYIEGWYLSSTITIPAVWGIRLVANIGTKARSSSTLDRVSSMAKIHFYLVRMRHAVNFQWLSGLVPIERSTVTFLCGLCCLQIVDAVQRTMWTACLLHWKDLSGIDTAFYWMYNASLRQLKYWSWLT